MKRSYNKNPRIQRIAKERIYELFDLAEQSDSEYSDKYVNLARKISMRYKVPIPKELKRRFCKHCYRFFVPGVNLRVRVNEKGVIYTCLSCNKQSRYPIK